MTCFFRQDEYAVAYSQILHFEPLFLVLILRHLDTLAWLRDPFGPINSLLVRQQITLSTPTFVAYFVPDLTMDAINMIIQPSLCMKSKLTDLTHMVSNLIMNHSNMSSKFVCHFECFFTEHATQLFFVFVDTLNV